ncbi:hypothetical protein MNB_SM-3-1190 [hydrothermal vent metagenome]|uniref:STAS domain-containing protein n=1 Tax=hydrothermal vent metagenome TaxID=652676 RepID=A0A1W1D384_9ZZZZ
MKIDTRMNAVSITLVIEGHITGINEVMQIKDIIASNAQVDSIEFIIKDAFVMPSALIGFLAKLANKDGKKIVISEAKDELKNLLKDLSLDQTFLIR